MKPLTRLFAFLLVCATAAAAQPTGAAPARAATAPATQPAATITATPAIWRIQGAHGTVYLFGSIHVMKPNVSWQSAPVKSAFTSADTVYVEVGFYRVSNATGSLSIVAWPRRYPPDLFHAELDRLAERGRSVLHETA